MFIRIFSKQNYFYDQDFKKKFFKKIKDNVVKSFVTKNSDRVSIRNASLEMKKIPKKYKHFNYKDILFIKTKSHKICLQTFSDVFVYTKIKNIYLKTNLSSLKEGDKILTFNKNKKKFKVEKITQFLNISQICFEKSDDNISEYIMTTNENSIILNDFLFC